MERILQKSLAESLCWDVACSGNFTESLHKLVRAMLSQSWLSGPSKAVMGLSVVWVRAYSGSKNAFLFWGTVPPCSMQSWWDRWWSSRAFPGRGMGMWSTWTNQTLLEFVWHESDWCTVGKWWSWLMPTVEPCIGSQSFPSLQILGAIQASVVLRNWFFFFFFP